MQESQRQHVDDGHRRRDRLIAEDYWAQIASRLTAGQGTRWPEKAARKR